MRQATYIAAGLLSCALVAVAAVIADRKYGENFDRRVDEWIASGRVAW